jgi:hypothetical protein
MTTSRDYPGCSSRKSPQEISLELCSDRGIMAFLGLTATGLGAHAGVDMKDRSRLKALKKSTIQQEPRHFHSHSRILRMAQSM